MAAILAATSTPVMFFTMAGREFMMSSTSPVTLEAPIGPSPSDTIVILFTCERGAEISAATLGSTWGGGVGLVARGQVQEHW